MVIADARDRRSRLMTLTAKGRSLLVRAVPVWQRTRLEIEALLQDGEPEQLRKNLRALC